MEYRGKIVSREGSELDGELWRALIVSHPQLSFVPDKTIPDPFRRGKTMHVRGHPLGANISIDSDPVGCLVWDEEFGSCIRLFGRDATVPIAEAVAQSLSAEWTLEVA